MRDSKNRSSTKPIQHAAVPKRYCTILKNIIKGFFESSLVYFHPIKSTFINMILSKVESTESIKLSFFLTFVEGMII